MCFSPVSKNWNLADSPCWFVMWIFDSCPRDLHAILMERNTSKTTVIIKALQADTLHHNLHSSHHVQYYFQSRARKTIISSINVVILIFFIIPTSIHLCSLGWSGETECKLSYVWLLSSGNVRWPRRSWGCRLQISVKA